MAVGRPDTGPEPDPGPETCDFPDQTESADLTLLVADDDPDLRLYVRRCVQAEGGPIRTVIEASDGQMALDILASERPDVLACDVIMPRIGGLEVCERLRSDPDISGIPVLLFTGVAPSDETARRAREVGADAVLLKPFNARRLCDAILRVISARSAMNAPAERGPERESRPSEDRSSEKDQP